MAKIVPRLERVLFSATDSKNITNTAAETSVIASGVGSLTMPPGFWYPGREVRIESKGVYTTPLILSELTLRIKLGSVLLSSLLTSALITSASRESFALQAAIVCESVGVNGMVRIGGNINYQGIAGRVYDNIDSIADSATVDTTSAAALDVTVQWDAATSSRLVRVNTFAVESLG